MQIYMKCFLTAEVTITEIYVIKSMPSEKTTGLNGFEAEFFRVSWTMVGDMILCRNSLPYGKCLERLMVQQLNLFPNAHS